MEWQLAARGGTGTLYFYVEDSEFRTKIEESFLGEEDRNTLEPTLNEYAWFDKNSGESTHPIGQKTPNPYGLYDLYGNVFEWLHDWHDELPMPRELTDYDGPAEGDYRMYIGGSWNTGVGHCLVTDRIMDEPDVRHNYVGFRLLLSLE